MTKFLIGTVERIKNRVSDIIGGYATIFVPELGRQLAAPDNCGPLHVVVEDKARLVSKGAAIMMHYPAINMPPKKARVVLEVEYGKGLPKVIGWGCAIAWQRALDKIAGRPIYRVVRENRFQGQVMKEAKRDEVVFTGTAEDMQEANRRDGLRVSRTDRFAPAYKTGPITARHRYEVRIRDKWGPCFDPRPMPKGPSYRIMCSGKRKIAQVTEGTVEELNLKFERGSDDLLTQFEGYIWFERYDANAPSGMRWAEVADPRPDFTKETPQQSEKKNPIAMAKREKKVVREFRSFEELSLA